MSSIILASTSPRRKEIMDSLGFEYEIVPSGYEEVHEGYTDPKELVETFALEKALDVAKNHTENIVIGADTMVLDADGKLMGKPKGREDAIDMMRRLQGRECKIFSGVAVLLGKSELVGSESVSVYFSPMTSVDIETYVDSEHADWHDKAGAFAVQGEAAKWIDRYEGEYETMLGMPRAILVAFISQLEKK